MLPLSIHRHPGQQRVLRSHQPPGQTESIAGALAEVRQYRGRIGLDLCAELVELPAHQHLTDEEIGYMIEQVQAFYRAE